MILRAENAPWITIVRVGAGHDVLQLVDPNDGSETRHQYVLAGGLIWRRRLPPESVGDVWHDDPRASHWAIEATVVAAMRFLPALLEYRDKAPDLDIAIVTRLESHSGDGETLYRIGRGYVTATEDNRMSIAAGPILGSWWDVPLPPCPDCGGDLTWAEAGSVPGARQCMGQPNEDAYDVEGGCGSLFLVRCAKDRR